MFLLIKKKICYIYSHPFGGVEVEDDWMEGSWAIEFEDIGVSILGSTDSLSWQMLSLILSLSWESSFSNSFSVCHDKCFLWWHSFFSQILSVSAYSFSVMRMLSRIVTFFLFVRFFDFSIFFLNWQYFLLFDSHLSLSWALSWALARFLLTDEPILVGNFRGLKIGVQFSYFLGVSQFYLIRFSWNLLSWWICVRDRLIFEITTCHNHILKIDHTISILCGTYHFIN